MLCFQHLHDYEKSSHDSGVQMGSINEKKIGRKVLALVP
jgi:hypothetical protein